MEYLYKISSNVAALALVVGLSFSTSMAQSTSSKTASSQRNTLKGKVVNSQSGQAVANAKVIAIKYTQTKRGNAKNDTTKNTYANTDMSDNQSPFTTTTDKNGTFKIKKIPSGSYTLKVKGDGYQTWKKQIAINNDASLTIKLEASQPTQDQ